MSNVIVDTIDPALFKAGAGDVSGAIVDVAAWAGQPVTAGGVSGLPNVNAGAISDNAVTADNLEAYKDDMAKWADIFGLDVDLENGETLAETIRLIRSSGLGVLTREGNDLIFMSADGSKVRITATVDANNQRILVVSDGT